MIIKLWFFHAKFSYSVQCKIAVDIFVCYNMSCYYLSLLVSSIKLSRLFVSRYDLVSFTVIVLFHVVFYALSK
jgi:hypothetical protein